MEGGQRRWSSGKVPAWREADLGSIPAFDMDVLNMGTPVATLPGVWRYKVSAGTGPPGVSIM